MVWWLTRRGLYSSVTLEVTGRDSRPVPALPAGGQFVPSHRADTPADAPTALRSPSSTHPTHPPLQRRRDLRTRAAVPAAHGGPAAQQRTHLAGLEWLDVPAPPTVPEQRQVPSSKVSAAWASVGPAEA